MTPHTPDSLLALARNFMESRVFLTGAELDLFTLLAPEPLSLDEVTSKTGADRRALEMLLDALAAQGLLVKEAGRWRTEPSVAPFLVEGAERSVLPMVFHAANLWNNWSELTRKVVPRRAGAAGAEFLAAFIGAMHVVAAPQADVIVAAVGAGGARRLLDVGGAPGADTLALLPPDPGKDGHAVRPPASRGDGAGGSRRGGGPASRNARRGRFRHRSAAARARPRLRFGHHSSEPARREPRALQEDPRGARPGRPRRHPRPRDATRSHRPPRRCAICDQH